TDKGRDLWPVIVSLTRWGDRWMAGDDGPPVELVHRDCGHTVLPQRGCPALPAPPRSGAGAQPPRRGRPRVAPARPASRAIREGGPVMQTVSVDPSVSRTPLALAADDVRAAVVLCAPHC